MRLVQFILGCGGLLWVTSLGIWLCTQANFADRPTAMLTVVFSMILILAAAVSRFTAAFHTAESGSSPNPGVAGVLVGIGVTILGIATAVRVLPEFWQKTFPASSAAASSLSPLEAAQREAIRRHPDLGVAGSRLNREFLALIRQYRKDRPDYFQDPEWPIRLAEESAQALATHP